MNPLVVKNLAIGKGIPKICISITEKTSEAILETAKKIESHSADLVEWRVDWFENFKDAAAVHQVLTELSEILKEMPLLFTFRTLEEGGSSSIDSLDYEQLNTWAIESAAVDIIDLELFKGEKSPKKLIDAAHEKGKFVIMSNHDFHQTPSEDEILNRLKRMEALGADILKIALMPETKEDVLTLMGATLKISQQYPDVPVVTMSMGQIGFISRMAGAFTGSAITFGAGKTPSAPGQIPAEDLRKILNLISNHQ